MRVVAITLFVVCYCYIWRFTASGLGLELVDLCLEPSCYAICYTLVWILDIDLMFDANI